MIRPLFPVPQNWGLSPALGLVDVETSPNAYFMQQNWVYGGAIVFAAYFLLQMLVPSMLPSFSMQEAYDLIPKLGDEYHGIWPLFGTEFGDAYVKFYAGCAALFCAMWLTYSVVISITLFTAPVRQAPNLKPNLLVIAGFVVLLTFLYFFEFPFDSRRWVIVMPVGPLGLAYVTLFFYAAFMFGTSGPIFVVQSIRFYFWKGGRVRDKT
jgi:hypothetical protein